MAVTVLHIRSTKHTNIVLEKYSIFQQVYWECHLFKKVSFVTKLHTVTAFNDIFEFADINCCFTNIGDNSKNKISDYTISFVLLFILH